MVQAKAFGYEALDVTDRNTLAWIARAHARAAQIVVRLVVGCRLDLRDALPVLASPLDLARWDRLCRLLTLGKARTGKGGCDLTWADLAAARDGLLLILLPGEPDDTLNDELRRLRAPLPDAAISLSPCGGNQVTGSACGACSRSRR